MKKENLYYTKQENIVLFCPANGIRDSFFLLKRISHRKKRLILQHRIQRLGRGVGAKKHEIYVAAFGGHLFNDLFLQGLGGGGMAPSAPPPGSATVLLADLREYGRYMYFTEIS